MKPMVIKKAPIIIDNIDFIEEYPDYIKDFIDRMEGKNLNNFYHNIKDIDIIPVNKNETNLPHSAAEYDVAKNLIQYRKGSLKKNIMHELLHVASRIELKDRILCGFMQVDNQGYGIGVGLNEGYTALMDDRYFLDYEESKINEFSKVYKMSKYICGLLEMLVGREEMERMYLDADLHSLFKELRYYSSSAKAYEFIINMDKLFNEADIKSIPNIRNVMILYNKIIYFLSECFLTRFNMLLDEKIINDEEYNKEFEFVRDLLDDPIVYFRVIKSRKMGKYIDKLEQVAIKNAKSRVS